MATQHTSFLSKCGHAAHILSDGHGDDAKSPLHILRGPMSLSLCWKHLIHPVQTDCHTDDFNSAPIHDFNQQRTHSTYCRYVPSLTILLGICNLHCSCYSSGRSHLWPIDGKGMGERKNCLQTTAKFIINTRLLI